VEAFARNIGDYTPPYMYLLYLVSRVPQLPDVYLIKFFSIGFDYMAAFFVMQLAGLKHKGLGAQLGFLMLGLWGPTVLLNGAYWAQCDIIYAGFLLGGLYFALADKPYRAVAFFGVAMALKLQAVFLMPMLLVLYGARKISLKHVLMFPLAFFAAMLPAIAAGKPIADIFEVYQAQMTNYPKLTLGALSIYQLLPETVSYRMFYNLGLQITLAVSVMFCGALYARGKRLTEGAILSAAMTLALAMPLLLPCMHERYFFVADVLGVAFFAHFPRKWYIPASVIFGSLVCYLVGLHAAPWRGMPMQVLTVLLAVMTGLCAAHTLRLARGAPCASDAQRV
jgi:Gpi18-like mannosyltransferase